MCITYSMLPWGIIFPWPFMTIKSNGESVECAEDYNNEIILGDAKSESLYDIWNGEKVSKI